MENQVTSKTTPVSHWSIFEGVSNFDQWLTGVVLLVTWISNIDYWKTGNQQINVDLVNTDKSGFVGKTKDYAGRDAQVGCRANARPPLSRYL